MCSSNQDLRLPTDIVLIMSEPLVAESTKKRITSMPLPKSGLIGCWILGGASIAVGGVATFISENQAGTTAFVIFGGVLLFLGISGRLPLALEVGNTRFDATFDPDSAFLAGRESAMDIGPENGLPDENGPRPPGTETPTGVPEEIDLSPWENTLFSGPWTCKMSATTYRQLDYWTRTGLVTPAADVVGTTEMQNRQYTLRDIISVAATKRMLELGMNLQNIRVAIIELATVPTSDLRETVIIFRTDGHVHLTNIADVLGGFESGVTGAIVPLQPVLRDVQMRIQAAFPVPSSAR